MRRAIEVSVREHSTEMRCPMRHPDGSGCIPHETVKTCLVDLGNDQVTYDKYLSLLTRNVAQESGGEAVFCPRCPWFMFVERAEDRHYMICKAAGCGAEFCGMCGEKPHLPRISCEALAQLNAENDPDIASLRQYMRESDLQICPRCGEGGELVEGCHYITCRCGANYCYDCGRDLPVKRQHYSHWHGGPYGHKCYGGKPDREGYVALGGAEGTPAAKAAECINCLGWSYGRTECSCRNWQGLTKVDKAFVGYLPKAIRGKEVLAHVADRTWRADNSRLCSPARGLPYRSGKAMSELLPGDVHLEWGEVVQGTDEGDGWVRCSVPG